MTLKPPNRVGLVLFALIYLLIGGGFVFANAHWPVGQTLWPYTGIGLAGILIFGFRIWPLILALNFALQVIHYPAGIAVAQAMAETAEVCTAAWLLQRTGFRVTLERFRDAILLLIVGGVAGAFLGAGLKQVILLSLNLSSWGQFKFYWLAWTRGDGLGIVIFTPILLSWLGDQPKHAPPGKRIEAWALLAIVGLLSWSVLYSGAIYGSQHNSSIDLFFIAVFWAATRFGVRGGMTISAIAAFVALIESLREFGSAGPPTLSEGFFNLWIFLSLLSGSSLLMATAIAERAQVYGRNAYLADVFRSAATGVSEGTGEHFFELLVQHLASALRVDSVLIGAVEAGKPGIVQTLAVFANRALQPNFEYALEGTPCKNVFGQQLCYYPAGVADIFAEDVLLRQMNVDSYLGIPLFSSSGEAIGLLAAMKDSPIENIELATSIIQIYSIRAATELERLRSEESLRASEEKFRQIQKMQALGTLAGGIAHDFNNMLTVIKGCSTLALDDIAPSSPAHEDIQEIQKAADRAAALTSQLLAFSRQQIAVSRSFKINTSILEFSKMLKRLLGEDIKVDMQLAADVDCIHIDPSQFDQILMNLAVNARDAMPKGGLLAFRTSNVQVEPADASQPVKSGAYVLLQVTDSGVGMDSETQQRIFEPFFTTKAVGEGTGLGLATVYGIMEQLGGHVSVTSEIGKGASFTLWFPQCEPERAYREAVSVGPQTTGHETVLLVEDDAALRHLAERILDSAGYKVLSASGVESAERILHEFTGEIALVVTDVVMPDGGGEALCAKLKQDRPEMKVLFISGYTDGRIPGEYLGGEQLSFLAKPFEPAQLVNKVRRLLDAPNPVSRS